MSHRPSVGLALGGGGARGLAHIGVLKVLEREGIPVDFIAGTSMGAIVGAGYAIEPNAAKLERRATLFLSRNLNRNPVIRRLNRLDWAENPPNPLQQLVRVAKKELFLNLAMFKKSLISEKDMEDIIARLLPDIDLGDTRIPFLATVVDLISGEGIALHRGSLLRAVMASCAVPGFLPLVRWGKKILADGGIVGTLPVEPLRAWGAEITVGVYVGNWSNPSPSIEDGIDAINRVAEIMNIHLDKQLKDRADVLIEPSVNQFQWIDFMDYKTIIREGEVAAEAKIEEIRQQMGRWRRAKLGHRFRDLMVVLGRRSHQRASEQPFDEPGSNPVDLAG